MIAIRSLKATRAFLINVSTMIINFLVALNNITTIFFIKTIFYTQYMYKGAATLSTNVLNIPLIFWTMKLMTFLTNIAMALYH